MVVQLTVGRQQLALGSWKSAGVLLCSFGVVLLCCCVGMLIVDRELIAENTGPGYRFKDLRIFLYESKKSLSRISEESSKAEV